MSEKCPICNKSAILIRDDIFYCIDCYKLNEGEEQAELVFHIPFHKLK